MPIADVADLLRLLAVPVLGWTAWRDVRTRRVPTRAWYPLVALGIALLAWETLQVYVGPGASPFVRRLFAIRVLASLGLVVPFAYLAWRLGGFGGADAKALMALAVLFPGFPQYVLPWIGGGSLVVPVRATPIGVFSVTILTNTVLLAAAYPAWLTVRNAAAGDLSRVMVVGRRVRSESIPRRHGSLLETPDGFTASGLDVDALRMYLRWRGTTLAELRSDPDRYCDPASLPAERAEPDDGAIDPDGTAPGASAPGREDRYPTRSNESTPTAWNEEAAAVDDPVRTGTVDDPETTAAIDDPVTRNRPSGSDADSSAGGEADRDASPADTDRPVPDGVDPDDAWGAEAFLGELGWGAYGTDPSDLRDGLEVLTTREQVWYSPGLPFLVPTFLGLLAGIVYGDLLLAALVFAGAP